jgi:DNA-binding beta-propeller fold protein YncE
MRHQSSIFWVAFFGLMLSFSPFAGAASSPVRIAEGPKDTVLVSDYRRQAIVHVDLKNLKQRRKLKIDGKPLGVTWADGLVYVGNESSGQVEVYGSGSKILRAIGEPGGMIPNDLAIDREGDRLFVADCRDQAVKVFTLDGDYLFNLGAASLAQPVALSYDPLRRELLVSDFGRPESGIPPAVYVFDGEGAQLARIPGSQKTGMFSSTTIFLRPQGVVGSDGRICLVDSFLGRLLVLDRASGSLLASFDTSSSGEKLLLPLDLFLLPGGEVLVTNNRAGCLSRLNLAEVLP